MSTRQLGLGMATALVVGNTIGMGIFMQPAALAPFGLNALTGWAAVILGCVCLALTFAALARKLPQADGPFGYVRSTLGEAVAFPALWSYWISCWVTMPVLSIGVVGYFITVFPAAAKIPPAVLAVTFMWTFVGVNLLGVKTGGRVQVDDFAAEGRPAACWCWWSARCRSCRAPARTRRTCRRRR